MAKRNIKGDSQSIVAIFRDVSDANEAIDRLCERGLAASPIPSDQAKTYRSNIRPDDILVCVECGDNCELAKTILTDYGASQIGATGSPFKLAAAARGKGARPILTPHDTERVLDIDGELEVKDGPYVEPDLSNVGDFAYP